MKDWKEIADNLSKAGWTWGCTSRVDSNGKTIYVADAQRGNANRFVVRADDELTAFVELERQIRTEQEIAAIHARHATDPVWKWFNGASTAYWDFAARVAAYFPSALSRVRARNPLVAIAVLMLVFIAGFIVVPPLYFIIGPLVQLGIVIIAVIWTCLAGLLGWYRTQETP